MNIQLIHSFVEELNVKLDPTKIKDREMVLSEEGEVRLKTPTEENNSTFLLVSSGCAKSQDVEGGFEATFVANFFFLADEKISDYDAAIKDECLPVIRTKTNEFLGGLLRSMGAIQAQE